MDTSKFNATFNSSSSNNGRLSASETRIIYSGTPEEEEFIEDEQLFILPSDGSNSRMNEQSGSLVRPEEVIIVSAVLILWISVIALFIHKWGKIRGLEPYIPHFDRTSLHTHPSTATNQVSAVHSGTSISSTAINVPPAGVNAIGHAISNCNGTNLPSDQLAQATASTGDTFASVTSSTNGNSSKYFTTNSSTTVPTNAAVTSVNIKNKWLSSTLHKSSAPVSSASSSTATTSSDHRRRCYTSANSVSSVRKNSNNNNSNNNNLPTKMPNGRRISLDPDLVGCVLHSQGSALGRGATYMASASGHGRRKSIGHLTSTRAISSFAPTLPLPGGGVSEHSTGVATSSSKSSSKLYPSNRMTSKSSGRIHQASREYFYPYSHRKPRASIDSSTINASHMVQFSLDSPVVSSQALPGCQVNCTTSSSEHEKKFPYLNHKKKIHPQLDAGGGEEVEEEEEHREEEEQSEEGEDDQLEETSHLLCNSTESKCIYHSARSLTQGKEQTRKTLNSTSNESRPFYSACMSDRLDRTLARVVDQRIGQQRRAQLRNREYRSYIDIPSLVLLRMASSEPNIAESRFDS